MKNALNNQVGMLGNMFLWLAANLKEGAIYFIKQALPPNISAGSVVENPSTSFDLKPPLALTKAFKAASSCESGFL